MIEQQLQEQIGRAILQPIIVNSAALIPNPTAGYLLGWDSTGTYLTNYAPTGGGSVIQIPVPISQGGTGTGSTAYCSLTANVTGTLPIANGGTGSASTAYCSLTANVSGILPVANGGTGSANAANTASGVVILDSGAKLPAVDGSQLTNLALAGRLLKMTVFTSSGTFTKQSGTNLVLVECVGGGGEGYNSGSEANGGTTSFGAICSATGGGHGTASGGASGGVGSGGDLNLYGQNASLTG